MRVGSRRVLGTVGVFALLATSGCGAAGTAISRQVTATATACPQAAYGKPCVKPVVITPTSSPGTISYLAPSSVSFVDARTGWVVGVACDVRSSCRPGIARTDDGGATWSELPQPPQRTTDSDAPWPSRANVYFASGTHGWLFNPYLAETADGGRTWKMLAGPGSDPITYVLAFGGATWLMTGCNSAPCGTTVWRSTSGGSFEAVALPAAGAEGLGVDIPLA